MRSFNVLDPAASIFGKKMLEASAGTGKTFAIEHLVARLLLEAPEGEQPLSLNQILVITFTKAAARELRMRIHATLKKAGLSSEGGQIFTIHGFCQKMLTRFGLEANRFSFDSEKKSSIKQQSALLKFLKEQEALCPEQLGLVIGKKNLQDLCSDLLDAFCPDEGKTFAETQKEIEEIVRRCPWFTKDPHHDFESLWKQFKISGFKKEHLDRQVCAFRDLLKDPSDPKALGKLLHHKDSLFHFLSPENQKLRVSGAISSDLFDWALREVAPKIREASDPKKLFNHLRFAAESLIEEEDLFSHELLLVRCRKASRNPTFCQAVRESYKAVIIDEFQDTDALQWEIINRLFYDSSRLFCLVGDPKQSIYRFRKADLYSYFGARKLLGEESCYSLDTNYRSSPELLSALNDLFCDDNVKPWLLLPREQRGCVYLPLKAGVSNSSPLGGKGIQFFTGDPLAYAAAEIAKMTDQARSIAILVKDHKEAAQAQAYLQSRGFSVSLKNTKLLSETFAARAWEELFDALYNPMQRKPFLMGPFSEAPLQEWRDLLEHKGLSALLRAAAPAEKLFQQIAELLLEISSPTFEKIKRFFRNLETEKTPCRVEQEEEGAVRIITMHASKGLEFDVVFAFGVTKASPKEEDLEEQEAEKLRQFYVALTRAKWRLYIPLSEIAPASPLAIFFNFSKLGNEPQQIVEALCRINPSIGLDCSTPESVFVQKKEQKPAWEAPLKMALPHSSSRINSFTSLAKSKGSLPSGCSEGEPSVHTLPRGVALGVSLHRVFERIFSEEKEASKIVAEEALLGSLVEWEEVLLDLVSKVTALPFLAEAEEIRPEVEFLFSDSPNYLKGFIDLLFVREGRLYFLDWKTNWLGKDDQSYTEEALRNAMDLNDYWLQASLYAEALKRTFPHIPFGGAYYLFLRGINTEGKGVLFFNPEEVQS